VHEPTRAAVPGFGEVHKHIESSHLTPEWEAALVIPRGNNQNERQRLHPATRRAIAP
jgi:adenine deaminase